MCITVICRASNDKLAMSSQHIMNNSVGVLNLGVLARNLFDVFTIKLPYRKEYLLLKEILLLMYIFDVLLVRIMHVGGPTVGCTNVNKCI